MVENLFQAQYDITKKTRIKKIYDENKLLIFSFVFILIIFLGSVSFYISNKEKQKILISDNYVKAKIFLANGNKIKAIDLLKNLIFLDDAIYSTLSFFLILDQKLQYHHHNPNNSENESIFTINGLESDHGIDFLYYNYSSNSAANFIVCDFSNLNIIVPDGNIFEIDDENDNGYDDRL